MKSILYKTSVIAVVAIGVKLVDAGIDFGMQGTMVQAF